MRRPSFREFLVLSFLLLWGIDLGVLGMAYLFLGGQAVNTPAGYFLALWSIIVLRFLFTLELAGSLGLKLTDLLSGRLTLRGILFGIGIVALFKGLEVLYSGSFSLQAIEEFRAFQKIGHSVAPLLFTSQYIYYFIEILAVNLLYTGTAKFAGRRRAILAPVFLWGALHVLNAFKLGPLLALLLGLYMALFALLTYTVAYREESLRLPVVVWFLNIIV